MTEDGSEYGPLKGKKVKRPKRKKNEGEDGEGGSKESEETVRCLATLSLKCAQCESMFTTKEELEHHMEQSHGTLPFRCLAPGCALSFEST